MTRGARRLRTVVLIAALGGAGCVAAPAPEALFADAEQLRARHERQASEQAIAAYREAVDGWTRQGAIRPAARAWHRIGETHWRLGELPEALAAYRTALDLVRRVQDPLLESEIRSDLGVAQAFAAEGVSVLDEARAQCEAARALAHASNADRERALALMCLGEVEYFNQNGESALGLFQDAGALFEALGDLPGQAEARLLEGHVLSDLGRLDSAQAALDRGEALWTRLGDPREVAIATVAQGRLQTRRGDFQAALNRFQEALAALEPMGDAIWQGSALTGIAQVYLDLGDDALALPHLERALALFEAAGLRIFAVDVLMSLGGTYLAAGEEAHALSRFERALALSDELGVDRWKAWALRFIGVVHLVRRQPADALVHLERAWEWQRRVSDPRLERMLHADTGDAQELLGRRDAASGAFERAVALSRATHDRATESRALYGLARTSLAARDLDRARRYIERALAIAESLRTAVQDRDLRASFVASVYEYHAFHVDVLLRLHRARPGLGLAAKAFEASERARARSLLDSLVESGIDLRAGVEPELLQREQRARLAFDEWAHRRATLPADAANGPEGRQLAREYRVLEEQYNRIESEIRSRSPRYAALVNPEPLTTDVIRQSVLDDDTILLEYALGEDRSYVWVVSRDGLAIHELPPRADIERTAAAVYEHLTARLQPARQDQGRPPSDAGSDAAYWSVAERLSEMILSPVAGALRRARLLVVADGLLQLVPFSALPVPGRPEPVPLIAEHTIVSLPSASVLGLLRLEAAKRARPTGVVAVLADPVFEPDDPRLRAERRAAGRPADAAPAGGGGISVTRLAATRLEAEGIVAAAQPGVAVQRLGFDASRATALGGELARYRIVHFATHAVMDDAEPGLSGLVLSLYDEAGQPRDGFLRLRDVYGLRLPADLVVLSACSTALGRQVKGEGLQGLVRGFFHAGAARVVASLWKVDDEATGELMRRFYVEMLQRQQAPADALRQAQLATWRQPGRRHPFYWAAFVIQGEWR